LAWAGLGKDAESKDAESQDVESQDVESKDQAFPADTEKPLRWTGAHGDPHQRMPSLETRIS
jgi:hypothetical protein